jgi:hypothetical protein
MAEVKQTVLVQGEDRDVEILLLDESDGLPVDLTGVTEINATTKGTAANVSFTLTASEIIIVEAIHGKITIVMSDVKTALMAVGEQNLEVIVDWLAPTAGRRRIFQALKVFNVKKKLFT